MDPPAKKKAKGKGKGKKAGGKKKKEEGNGIVSRVKDDDEKSNASQHGVPLQTKKKKKKKKKKTKPSPASAVDSDHGDTKDVAVSVDSRERANQHHYLVSFLHGTLTHSHIACMHARMHTVYCVFAVECHLCLSLSLFVSVQAEFDPQKGSLGIKFLPSNKLITKVEVREKKSC